MTTNYNARIVSSGLVLNLDASNARSLSNVSANLLTFPEDFTNAIWLKGNCSFAANQTLAPDGSLSASLMYETIDGAVQYHNSYQLQTVVAGTYTFSVYVKIAGTDTLYNGVEIFAGGGGSNFNLNTGGKNFDFTSAVGTLTTLPNGWFKISTTITCAAGTYNTGVQTSVSTGNTNYQGSGKGRLYVWGAQFELGSTATTYYPASTTPSRQWTDLSGTDNHATLLPNALSSVEVLVVGGGGGAGYDGGGGGGGGGVIYNSNFSVTSGTNYTVTVGTGGAAAIAAGPGVNAASGGNSIFGSLIALGGGGAGSKLTSGLGGGSGGGTGHIAGNSPGPSTPGQGYSGGIGDAYSGGGGGGAGGPGTDASSSPAITAGKGGSGLAYNISGTLTYYGGGGGGGSWNGLGGLGGLGGGGTGGGVVAGTGFGTSGTGYGAGGAANGNIGNTLGCTSGAGFQGIVIVRYLGYQKATGGTIVYDGTYTTHTFTSVGSTTFQPASSAAPQYTTLKGGALTFNGSTHHLTTPNSGSLCLTNDLTINVWMYTTGATSSGLGLVAKAPESGDYDYMLYLTSSSTSIAFYKKNAAGVAESSTGYSSTFIGNWVNVCYTVSGTTCVGYINGTVVDNRTFTNAGIRVTNNPLRIGHAWGNVFYTGYLPVVQIYNRALTATEVTNNFMALRGRYGV